MMELKKKPSLIDNYILEVKSVVVSNKAIGD